MVEAAQLVNNKELTDIQKFSLAIATLGEAYGEIRMLREKLVQAKRKLSLVVQEEV